MLSLEARALFFRILEILEQASRGEQGLFFILSALLIVCGLIYAFFGYRIYHILLMVLGFVVGSVAGLALSDYIPAFGGISPFVIRLLVVLTVAITATIAAPRLFYFSSFLLGGFGFALALQPLAGVVPVPYGWLAEIGFFVAGGLLGLLLMRPSLIAATAIVGGFLLTAAGFAVGLKMGWLDRSFSFLSFYACWLVLSLFGIVSQLQQDTPARLDPYYGRRSS